MNAADKRRLESEAGFAAMRQAADCWADEPGFNPLLDHIAKQTAAMADRENIYR